MIDEKKLLKNVIMFRRDLHKIPELGFNTIETKKYISDILNKLNCEITPLLENGLAAYFDFGKTDTVAFRCDMDGLPIDETNEFTFTSKHLGCSHSCGHDGHMANMLGFALVLNSLFDSSQSLSAQFGPEANQGAAQRNAATLSKNVLLIFQPAEETILGAKAICNTSVFNIYNVSSIYGLHLWPGLKAGEIFTKPGAMMAHSTEVNVEIHGKSAHCGKPNEGHDALAAACSFVSELYEFKAKEIVEPSIIKFGKLKSGTVRNAISPYSKLEGTMRTFSLSTRVALENAMKNASSVLTQKYKVDINIDTSIYHPAVINDESLFNDAVKKNKNIKFLEKSVFIAEDFSFYQENLPGLFFFLGTGMDVPLHSSDFDFDESALLQGINLFLSLI